MNKDELSQLLRAGRAKLLNVFKSLSPRETMIVGIAALGLCALGIAKGVSVTASAFTAQRVALTQLQQSLDETVALVNAYTRISAQKSAIEAHYKQIERSEGILSSLERLVKDKVGVTPDINDLPTLPFGGKYEQVPYRIRFRTPELSKVSALLEELQYGTQRYLVTSVELAPLGTQGIKVTLEVSTITPTSTNESGTEQT